MSLVRFHLKNSSQNKMTNYTKLKGVEDAGLSVLKQRQSRVKPGQAGHPE